jgi:succinate dehydrogenase/fumarate reductase flavoprotein subunit
VSGRVARRQAARYESKEQAAYDEQQAAAPAEPQQAYYEEPAQSDTDAQMDEIRQLAALKDQGLLTEEEFAAKKKQILGI